MSSLLLSFQEMDQTQLLLVGGKGLLMLCWID